MHLQLEHISKSFGLESVINDLGFSLEADKTFSILGPSGCGKTTLLKIIAGLQQPDNGSIFLDGIDITGLPANRRNIVYIYQEPLLFPHLNAFENIAFGLRIRKVSDAIILQQVMQLIERLGLDGQSDKLPTQLSGGQRQRVAFGRALIINPPVLLLDEPFASLDFDTRSSMQNLFKEISAERGITSVFVTHDLKEAILMADQIATMSKGTLHCFESVEAFSSDPSTGVSKEINFWTSLNKK